MDEKKEKKVVRQQIINKPQIVTAMIVVCAAILGFFALYRLDAITAVVKKILGILAPVIYGMAIAYILSPVANFWENLLLGVLRKRMKNLKKADKISRGVSIGISLILAITIVFVLFYLVIPELISTVYGLVISLPGQLENAEKYLTNIAVKHSDIASVVETVLSAVTEWFEKWIKTGLLTQVTGITTGILNVFNVVVDIVIGFIISVYVLSSREMFKAGSKKMIYAVFSREKANEILKVARKSNEIFGGFISGKMIDSLIIGLLCFIGLSILNMPYVLLVSVIVGVTNVIPFFGPYIGAVPSAFLIFLADPMKGLYFIIFILVLQQIDGNIIGPKILGEFTGLSPFWVVFAILLGGGLFGFVGMLLGVPVFAVIYYIIQQLLENLLKEKELPIEDEVYIDLHHIDVEKGVHTIHEMEEVEVTAKKQDTLKKLISQDVKEQGEDK